MQPWLRVERSYCDPGPSWESASQSASWIASPVFVKNVVHCTTVSGYQYGEPFGQGDCIFHGCDLRSTFIGPKSVPIGPLPQMPVVTSVSLIIWPFSNDQRCWSWNETMTAFAGRPAISACRIWPWYRSAAAAPIAAWFTSADPTSGAYLSSRLADLATPSASLNGPDFAR